MDFFLYPIEMCYSANKESSVLNLVQTKSV